MSRKEEKRIEEELTGKSETFRWMQYSVRKGVCMFKQQHHKEDISAAETAKNCPPVHVQNMNKKIACITEILSARLEKKAD